MNKSFKTLTVASAIGLATALAGCAAPDPYGPNNYPVSSANPYPSGYPYGTTVPVAAVEYGRVTNVQLVAGAPVANPNRAAAGSVIGAVVGGLLGNQIGHGSGRAAATVLGAVGGAAVGNNIAQNSQPAYNTAGPVYRITVQTDSGYLRTYDVNTTADLRPGDRVRIDNGMIYLG
jgi:outer membrane lipoprotein SlyB